MIRTDEDVARGLGALLEQDPRLGPIASIAGPVPLRPSPAGLKGLVGTIVAQQVSRASAGAILARLCAAIDVGEPAALLSASDAEFRVAGLSRAKVRTLRAIAEACLSGRLDFGRLGLVSPAEAIADLTALHGIGLWTAECYLLFSAGHPDIFPSGDLALQVAVGHGLGHEGRPKEKVVAATAASWSPHRSVAARLFWAYYAAITARDATPVAGMAAPASVSPRPVDRG